MLYVSTCLWDANERSQSFSQCYNEVWVERLYDGFARNLTIPFEFVLFADRERKLSRPIRQATLERRPIGYGSMIEPFKLDGPTIIVGLDTVITGNVDALARYCMTGNRMLLPRDPFFPSQACNGVALVPQGYRAVWDEWKGENDMEWVRHFPHDYIERHFPRLVESYKGHVKREGLGDTRIVYFHGKEKPHELQHIDWIKQHWGGELLMPARFVAGLNNDPSVMLAQMRENMQRDIPWLAPRKAHAGTMLLVGGGPSLKESLGKLRFHQSRGGDIFALNGTHDWLIQRGVVPDYHVVLDSRPENVTFVQSPRKGVKYLVGAQCHTAVFDALKGYDATLWFSEMGGVDELVKGIEDKPVCVIGGGATVGMKTMFMAYSLGYRKIHFFGFDSCYRDGENHAYRQALNDGESVQEYEVAGRRFVCAPWMAKQAMEFQEQARQLLQLGVRLTVHGDGLIPHIMETWQCRQPQPAMMRFS